MSKPKKTPVEQERRLRHHPSARMTQDQSDSEKNTTPEQKDDLEKFRNRGLNEDEQKKAVNYAEDNAQSTQGSSPRNEGNSVNDSISRENGQVEDTNDKRLEADDDKEDIN